MTDQEDRPTLPARVDGAPTFVAVAGARAARDRQPPYVLVTAARNEAAFIERTLGAVVGQTVKPLRWVIVSDGSTDGTDDIVSRYAQRHPWIQLIRTPERHERTFAGKARAFNLGWETTKDLAYEAIGNLDADVSFAPEYFAFLLERLAAIPPWESSERLSSTAHSTTTIVL